MKRDALEERSARLFGTSYQAGRTPGPGQPRMRTCVHVCMRAQHAACMPAAAGAACTGGVPAERAA